MSENGFAGMGARRFFRAAALVVLLVVCVPGVDAVMRAVPNARAPDGAFAGIDSRALIASGDAQSVVEHLEDLARHSEKAALPEAFESEVGVLPGARDIRMDDTGSVVGYTVSGGADDVAGEVDSRMRLNGWAGVPMSGVSGATYVKEDGAYRWALISCIQVGANTSVVVRGGQQWM